jgi:hypothetical protein
MFVPEHKIYDCVPEPFPRGKVNLTLSLINLAQSHDHVWGCESMTPSLFTSTLDGAEWSA